MSKKLIIFDVVVFVISLAMIITSNIIFGFSPLSIISSIATIFGIIYSLLAIGASKKTFYFGILNNIFFGVASMLNKVYLLSVYALAFCIPFLIIGIIKQYKHPTKNEPRLRHISLKYFFLLLGIQVLAIGIFLVALYLLHGSYWYLDAVGTSFLCISLILLTTYRIESYIYFTIGNICNLVLYTLFTINDIRNITTIIMWLIYFISGIIGYINWLRIYKRQQLETISLEENKTINLSA
ncbi:MAG: nicotinamide mononucleotide transporter family protein [Acholeplasmatales bacterium]|jgi:nicotinamide mononucleotide transporter PnuC|nr:nicotinamide mononucleotide transporter family protein [Acholeplasmatales bacterium]